MTESFLLHTWILTVGDNEQLTYLLDRRLLPLVFLFSGLAVATFILGFVTKTCQIGRTLTTS